MESTDRGVSGRLGLLIAAGLGAIIVAAVVLGLRSARETERDQPAPLAVGTAVDKALPPLRLVDEDGRQTSLAAMRGRYVVLAPSLTLCHETCPLTTGALERLQARLHGLGIGSDRVVVAEASVDPWRDTPARIRAFKRLTGTDVRFLTGSRAQLHALWKQFGVEYHRVAQDDPPDTDWLTHRPETFDVQHTDGVFVIDPNGHWRVVVLGMPDVGNLPSRLTSLLSDEGRDNERQPDSPWTVDELLDDVLHVMGHPTPPGAQPFGDSTPKLAHAGKLLDLGTGAIAKRIAALRGRPAVINEWASWCTACEREFGLFGSAAAHYGKRVAFVGLDLDSTPGKGARFLASHPVGYQSFFDPDGKAAGALGRVVGLPTTVFVDARGKVTAVHSGQYPDASALAGDIAQHALR